MVRLKSLPSTTSATLLLIEQIRPRTAQVDNLRTAIPIFLQSRALKAVVGVANALGAANDTSILVVSEGALVADADQGRGTHVGVAHGTFAVTLIAQAADRDAGLLAAHDKIGMMARHGGFMRSGASLESGGRRDDS